jgi:copper chaperone CopZ
MHRKCRIHVSLLVSLATIGATAPALAVPTQARVEQVQIVAEEMCCKGCVRKVSGQLYAARGVKEVGVDMKTHTVTVALPAPNAAMLGLLWHAVEKGEGGPTKLVAAEATYTLIRPKVEATEVQQKQQANTPLSIVIDNLHCQGCAKKIAAQLYAVKGVTKVSVDMQHDTLFVEARPEAPLSPWNLIHAVTQANERPLAVNGPYGTLAIEWSTERAPKNHQPSQQTNVGGFQK